jgi:hypothetical protein
MPNEPTRFRREVVDITNQITRLGEHRAGLLEADTMSGLDRAVEGLADSMNVLKACVAVLKYNVGLQLLAPEE